MEVAGRVLGRRRRLDGEGYVVAAAFGGRPRVDGVAADGDAAVGDDARRDRRAARDRQVEQLAGAAEAGLAVGADEAVDGEAVCF